MKIRIKFEKQGPMKFVGHLDIMRYFQKAIRRAGIDIKYSEGFSPHQIMSFAAPLGVGLTSSGEYFDIEVNSAACSNVMVQRLNEAMAEGMKVIHVRKLDEQAKNAMSIVAAADYTISIRPGYTPGPGGDFFQQLIGFLNRPEINILKKTKRGEKIINLKPLIYEADQRGNQLFLKLSAGSTDNIKPELVLQAYFNELELAYPPFAFEVNREEVYTAVSDLSGRRLIPLEALGEEIE